MGILGVPQKSSQVLQSFILGVILIAIMVGIPQAIGLGRGGFNVEGLFKQFSFYIPTGIAFLLGIIILTFIEQRIKKGDAMYGEGMGFFSPGLSPHLKTPIFHNGVRLFFACAIIFGIVGLYTGVTNQTTFTGVGSLQQGFTAADNALYAASLVAASENLGVAFFIAFALFGLRFYARKQRWGKQTFLYIAYVAVPVVALGYGYINHLLRYASSDVQITTVMVFWFIGGLITLVSGSFIPFWVMHIANNLFYDLGQGFSNDIVTITGIVILVVMSSLWVWYYMLRKDAKKVQEI